MYNCGKCKRTVPQKRTMFKIIEYRLHQHPLREKVYDLGNGRFKDDRGGVGKQIVRETPVCFRCHEDNRTSLQENVN